MSNQLIPVFQQYSNNNGATESGLVLHTYEAGTLINKETFQTYGGTSNTNPIVLDSAGYPPAGIYGTGSYRLILKDAEGVTLKDLDNVVLTEGLQPDANGDYVMGVDLNVQGALTVGDVVIDASGDYVVTLDGTEVQRITPEGNISYYMAFVPAGLTAGYFHVFNGESEVTVVNDGDQTSWTGNNFYHATTWKFKTSGYAMMRELDNATGEVVEYVSDASGASNSAITWVETKRTTPEGNVSINGTPIPSDILTGNAANYRFVFDGLCCEMYPRAGTTVSRITGYNLYNSATGFKSLENTAAFCTYRLMNATTNEAKQSSVVSSAVGQPLTMSTPLPWT